MKTLKEHNADQLRVKPSINGAGVACDLCDEELEYVNPGLILTSNPAKQAVKCQCGFHGYKVV